MSEKDPLRARRRVTSSGDRGDSTREMIEICKLKEGRFVIIDNEPCRIVGFSAGKHGHAEAKVDAIGIFDSQKRSIVRPASAKVGVSIIERGGAQVLAVIATTPSSWI